MNEQRTMRLIINKAGGSSGGKNCKIALPNKWVSAMGGTPEDREVLLEFDGEKITIKKIKNCLKTS